MRRFLSLSCTAWVAIWAFAGCSGADAEGTPEETSLFVSGEELPGGSGTNTLLFGHNALSRNAENASEESELAFFSGNGFFNQTWVQAPASTEARDGLGPLFNARSCAACHFRDGRGRPPKEVGEPLEGLLFRISVGQDENGMPVGDPVYGGQLQPFAISDVPAEGGVVVHYEEVIGEYPDGASYSLARPTYELVELGYGQVSPRDGITLSPRVAPAMQGLGLLEAITQERLDELADEEDENGDGISGRIRWVPSVETGDIAVGRFGWKCEQPTVRQQAAGAFLGDMGLSTSLFSEQDCTEAQVECLQSRSGGQPEVSDDILDRVATYSSLVAVPARDRAADGDVLEGKRLFFEVGCESCHTAEHTTGPHALEELSGQRIFPYTDLLLHDMGEGLSDGDGSEELAREWRTPPLWALRFYPVVNGHDRLLHDGRARGVEEAILWHGGEAEQSRADFMDLSAAERALVIAFVESL